MARAAVLRAKQLVATGLCRLEPDAAVFAGHDIHLYAKGWHVEAVYNVFGRHHQLDPATVRDVQLVNLALSIEVLKLPHPLLGYDVNIEPLVGRAVHLVIDARAPGKYTHRDYERKHRPGDFKPH